MICVWLGDLRWLPGVDRSGQHRLQFGSVSAYGGRFGLGKEPSIQSQDGLAMVHRGVRCFWVFRQTTFGPLVCDRSPVGIDQWFGFG